MTTNDTTSDTTGDTTSTTTSGPKEWTREHEWREAAADKKNQQPEEWCLLVRETSSTPVVIDDWGYVRLVDAFARGLIDAGIGYAAVIERYDDPPNKLVWDWLTDVQFSYVNQINRALRIADEALPGLVKALVDTAGAMGAECLQRGFADWPTLIASWPTPPTQPTTTPAERTYQNLFPTVIARWGLAGNPTPAQAAAIDTKEIVSDAVVDLTRADLLELIRLLTTAAEQIGLLPDGTDERSLLRTTHQAPGEALEPPHKMRLTFAPAADPDHDLDPWATPS